MSKLIILSIGVLAIGGCATKTRFSDVKGHRIRTPLTDTNSVGYLGSISKDVCSAFVIVANADGVSAVK